MTDHLPELRSCRGTRRGGRASEHTELAIYEHGLAASYRTQCDQIDSTAIADSVRSALDEEMRVLDEGLERAGDSPAKKELVARLVAIQSRIDANRISRTFGG